MKPLHQNLATVSVRLRAELIEARDQLVVMHRRVLDAEQRVSDLERELAKDRDNYLREYAMHNEATVDCDSENHFRFEVVGKSRPWWKFWA